MEKQSILRPQIYSITASIYTLLFLVVTNFLNAEFPWVLFCIPAFLVWSIAGYNPHWMANKIFAFSLSIIIVSYYALLNLFLAPGHPWVIYIAYAISWYPFSILYARGKAFQLSMFGLVWSILFFSTVNIITSPSSPWAIYPIFAALWWPLSVYFYVYKRNEHE